MSQMNGIGVLWPCLIWEWTLRCRSRSPSFPLSRSSPSRALSRPRKRQCPLGTWRASGRRKGRRKICTRPGRWSGRSHCDWARGSACRGDREEAERPTDLRGGRGTGGQREYKKTKGEGEERRDRVSRFWWKQCEPSTLPRVSDSQIKKTKNVIEWKKEVNQCGHEVPVESAML